MQAGAVTWNIDVPQVAWWTFFLIFLGLVYYLRREDKREGYPLREDFGPPDPRLPARLGFPLPPDPMPYLRLDGTMTVAPHDDPDPPMAVKVPRMAGDPLTPLGDKLTSAVGAGTYTMRRDTPFVTHDGVPQVQPLRVATDWSVMEGDADPRGMRVLDVRFRPVGVVRDIWVDRGVKILRYLEIDLEPQWGAGPVMLPIYHCDIDEREREVRVTALRQAQFAAVPRLQSPDQITAREEDQVNGYYAGGLLHVNDFSGEEAP
jgi:photosynthetic reaction center H subunit